MIGLYRGLAFPVKHGSKGLFEMQTDINLIEGNIIQILSTRKGQRVMLPEFGSNILSFIHEPLDHITCALIKFELIDAISKWEKRIILDKNNSKVEAFQNEFKVKATLRYFLKSFNTNQILILEINKNNQVIKWLN